LEFRRSPCCFWLRGCRRAGKGWFRAYRTLTISDAISGSAPRPSGTGGLQTLCWRETDSNLRSPEQGCVKPNRRGSPFCLIPNLAIREHASVRVPKNSGNPLSSCWLTVSEASLEEELMTLAERLDTIRQGADKRIPADKRAIMHRATDDLRASGIMDGVIKVSATGSLITEPRGPSRCHVAARRALQR
jgi:hypothetical protein